MRSLTRAALIIGLNLASTTLWGCRERATAYGDLTRLADEYGSDKGTRGHRFTDTYELFVQPMRQEAKRILEIGVLKGASLRTWRDYFPNALIYGIDIEDTASVDDARIRTFVADQGDREQLRRFIDAHGGDFDVILDDGGHTMEQQQVSFGYLFKHVKAGGLYVIEDVHTSIYAVYQDRFGAMASGENTTLAMIDNFVRTGNVESRYMTTGERDYLTSNIASCNLHSQQKGGAITCLFRKASPRIPKPKAREIG